VPEHLHNLKRVLSSRKDFSLLLILFLMEFTRGAFFLTFLPLYAVKYLGLSVAASGLAISAHYFVETLFKGAAGWQLDRRGHRILNISFSLGMATLLLMKIYPTATVLVLGSAENYRGNFFGYNQQTIRVLNMFTPICSFTHPNGNDGGAPAFPLCSAHHGPCLNPKNTRKVRA
jgi:MFS family permease